MIVGKVVGSEEGGGREREGEGERGNKDWLW